MLPQEHRLKLPLATRRLPGPCGGDSEIAQPPLPAHGHGSAAPPATQGVPTNQSSRPHQTSLPALPGPPGRPAPPAHPCRHPGPSRPAPRPQPQCPGPHAATSCTLAWLPSLSALHRGPPSRWPEAQCSSGAVCLGGSVPQSTPERPQPSSASAFELQALTPAAGEEPGERGV